MFDWLRTSEVHCLLHGGNHGVADALLGLAQRAKRDPDAENVAEQHRDLTTAHPTGPCEQGDQGQEPRPEHRSRNAHRKGRPCAMPALLAVPGMQPMFGDIGLDLREVDHLMTHRSRVVDGCERRPAALAFLRVVVLDPRDLLRGQHLAPLRFVPRLPPRACAHSAAACRGCVAAPAYPSTAAGSSSSSSVRAAPQAPRFESLIERCLQPSNPNIPLRNLPLQLGDSLISRVRSHPSIDAPPAPRWKPLRDHGAISITYTARITRNPVNGYECAGRFRRQRLFEYIRRNGLEDGTDVVCRCLNIHFLIESPVEWSSPVEGGTTERTIMNLL